jgi:transcriptional regulator with XRE-family HTH domain
MSRIRVDDLHKKWMKDSKYRLEHEALEEEFSLVAALIEARTRAGLTQEQVARRMKTTQAVIARLEGGGSKPSTRTLERYAEATGSRLKISFEAEAANSPSRPYPTASYSRLPRPRPATSASSSPPKDARGQNRRRSQTRNRSRRGFVRAR